jgi:hypothetical protein
MLFGLALAALAVGPLGSAWAGEEEDRAEAQEIANMLRASGQIHNYNIAVKCKDGVVRLDGRVSSQEQLNTALMLISDMESVDQIVNGLKVGPAPAAAPTKQKTAKRSKIQQASANRPVPRGVPMAMNGASPAAYQQPAGPQGYPQQGPPGYPQQGPPGYPQQGPQGPRPMGYPRQANYQQVMDAPVEDMSEGMAPGGVAGRPMPAYVPAPNTTPPPAAYDQPTMPNYSWPSYAAYPNYAAVTYPKQYAASAWPYIGPFYPYPQVPLGWRKVSLEWDDGWWFLDFDDRGCH